MKLFLGFSFFMLSYSIILMGAQAPESLADKGTKLRELIKEHVAHQCLAMASYRNDVRRTAPQISADDVETRAKTRAILELDGVVLQALPHFFPESELIENAAKRKEFTTHYFNSVQAEIEQKRRLEAQQ